MRRYKVIVTVVLTIALSGCARLPFSDGALNDTAPGQQLNVAIDDNGVTLASPQNDLLGLGNRLVFSTADEKDRRAATIFIENRSNVVQLVDGIKTENEAFAVERPNLVDGRVAPGARGEIRVSFRPASSGVFQSNLVATLNGRATSIASLGGLSAKDFEGKFEPNLQQIFDALGYKVNVAMPASPPEGIDVPADDRGNSISKAPTPVGDEVLMPYMQKADPSKPVSMLPLANYISRSGDALGPLGIFSKGQVDATQPVLSFTGSGNTGFGGQNQQLLPGIGRGDFDQLTPAAGAVSSTSVEPRSEVFGVWDGGRKFYSDDSLNGGVHPMRFYSAVRTDGARVPNAYLVGIDSGSPDYQNFDYQDFVVLVTNVKPA